MHTEKDDKIIIKIKRAGNIPIPEYETLDAAGCDIYNTETVTLYPGVPTLVPTGLFVEIPKGYEIQVRPRSGLALKDAITVLNSPGTIDSDYRGELHVHFISANNHDVILPKGSKIVQGIFLMYSQPQFNLTKVLSNTERGEGAFGSTDKI